MSTCAIPTLAQQAIRAGIMSARLAAEAEQERQYQRDLIEQRRKNLPPSRYHVLERQISDALERSQSMTLAELRETFPDVPNVTLKGVLARAVMGERFKRTGKRGSSSYALSPRTETNEEETE